MTRRRDAATYPAGLRACAWCRTVKHFKAGIRYCSRTCGGHGSVMHVSEAAIQARAVKASQAATAAREQDVLARVAGMTAVEAYRLGVKHGHTQGYTSATYRARRDARTEAA